MYECTESVSEKCDEYNIWINVKGRNDGKERKTVQLGALRRIVLYFHHVLLR
jgi:hypothetical protein